MNISTFSTLQEYPSSSTLQHSTTHSVSISLLASDFQRLSLLQNIYFSRTWNEKIDKINRKGNQIKVIGAWIKLLSSPLWLQNLYIIHSLIKMDAAIYKLCWKTRKIKAEKLIYIFLSIFIPFSLSFDLHPFICIIIKIHSFIIYHFEPSK